MKATAWESCWPGCETESECGDQVITVRLGDISLLFLRGIFVRFLLRAMSELIHQSIHSNCDAFGSHTMHSRVILHESVDEGVGVVTCGSSSCSVCVSHASYT